MTQYVINIGAIPNDGTGDPLRTAFNETNLNFDQVFAAGPVLSNIQIANNTILTTNVNGNLVLAPNGIGVVQSNVNIVPNTANIRNLGSATRRWSTVYAQYLDVSANLNIAGNIVYNGDLTVDGNLTVQGNIIQVGNIVTETLTIQLANAASTANAANGSGITVGANDNIATLLFSNVANAWTTNIGISSIGNITAPYFVGNGSLLTGLAASYGNSNVVTLLAGFGSNTVSTTGNISGGYLFGNGSLLTGLAATYGNANVVAYGESGWAGNIVPNGNAVYSLGNSTNQWNDLYVSNATIFMNNVPVSLSAGNVLTVGGNAVLSNDSNTSITTTGTITADLLTANSVNIGNSNLLYNYDDDYLVFETLANAGYRPSNDDLYKLGNTSYRWSEVHANVYYGDGSQLTGLNTNSISNGNSSVDIPAVDGNVTVSTNGTHGWTFSTDGSTIFPTLTVARGDQTGTLTGQALLFGDSAQEALISTPDGVANVTPNSQRLVINPGAGAAGTTGEGGDIYLYAGRGGDAGGSGGDIKIRGGLGPVDGAGGYITMEGGEADVNGIGGYIEIIGGVSGNAAGGTLYMYGGQGRTGGDANVSGGVGTAGPGGTVSIIGGASANGQAEYGNIIVATGSKNWEFDNTGNLVLPIGGVVYETNIPDGGLNGKTIALKPQGGTDADQQLLIYPTVNDANHLHLTTGNLYNTELYLGDDYLYVKLANTGNVVVNSNDGVASSAQWNFDYNGVLTLPKGGVVSEGAAPSGLGNTIAITPSGGSDANQQLLVYPTGNIVEGNHLHLTTGDLYNTELFLGNDNLYVKLANTGNIVVNSNDNAGNTAQWTFGADGNLTVPGGMIINGNINTLGSQTALLQPTDDLPLAFIASGANGSVISYWAEDIANLMTSNIAAIYTPLQNTQTVRIVTGSNGGNIAIYDFDKDGVFTTAQVSATGNVTGNYFIGNGSLLTGISASLPVANGTSNFDIATANGNATITANSASTWTFGTDSALTLPASSGQIGRSGYPNGIDLYNNNGGTGYVRMNYADESLISADSGGAHVQTTGGTWDFDTTGNLTAPGNVSAVGNIIGGNIVTSGSGGDITMSRW
jgi:hypothetical protein